MNTVLAFSPHLSPSIPSLFPARRAILAAPLHLPLSRSLSISRSRSLALSHTLSLCLSPTTLCLTRTLNPKPAGPSWRRTCRNKPSLFIVLSFSFSLSRFLSFSLSLSLSLSPSLCHTHSLFLSHLSSSLPPSQTLNWAQGNSGSAHAEQAPLALQGVRRL